MQELPGDYQWERLYDQKPSNSLRMWESPYGPRVLERTEEGYAKTVRFQALIDNDDYEVYIVGPFNNWGEERLPEFRLEFDEFFLFAAIDLSEVSHQTPYKFLIKKHGKKFFLQDPAGVYFDDDGNSVFWDFYDPSAYQLKHPHIDTQHRSTRILQTDLPGLITHYADSKGNCGKDIEEKSYYRFIAESGVVETIKSLGFNTIQFLPFTQSIDGNNWKLRYLVPFPFAIQKNWGTPDEFAMMIDAFHAADIAVIGDFVLGHIPHKDFSIFGQPAHENGIFPWKKKDHQALYLKEETNWGTMRINFDHPYVREFFVSSCLHFLKYYRIDGLRIDNVDGIIRYGPNGDQEERPNGRTFLREVNDTIYAYNPHALIHYEAHFYYDDNAKLLVAPLDSDPRALGATAYNSSRLTYYFHTEFMPKSAEEVTPWKFKHISEEKEWGKSNSTVADFHNHDAAAGLMPMRVTGSYAYDALQVLNPPEHARDKIRVMEAIIAFATEGRILDLLQTFLLQMGTFEHDSSIQWYLTYSDDSKQMLNYKQRIHSIMEDPAFWPLFTNNRQFLNVDDQNRVLVVERSAEYEGRKSRYIIVINLAGWKLHHYKVGVKTKTNYQVIFNSDETELGGSGETYYPEQLENQPSENFGLLDREVELFTLPAYGVVVMQEIKD